jgi:hypothetical protein
MAIRKQNHFPNGKNPLELRNNQQTIEKRRICRKYSAPKTFVSNLFSGEQVKNRSELEIFLTNEHHPVIVSREMFEIVNRIRKIDS